MTLTKALRDWAIANLGLKSDASDAAIKAAVFDALGSNKLTQEKFSALLAEKATDTAADAIASAVAKKIGGGNPLFNGIRVKEPGERYDNTRKSATSKKTGLTLPVPSALENAKMATFLKFTALKSGLPVNWSEHDEQMLAEMFAEDRWQVWKGLNDEEEIRGERARGLLGQKQVTRTPFGTKALLDDGTSGGLELAPILFDDILTTYPQLNGELMPYVRVTDIARGRRIESGALGSPTMTWGSSEGTALTPFSTTSLASAIDRTIFPLTCVVEVGMDFLSDAGVDVASALVENIQQSALTALDDVIANGDGTTQPLGLLNTSGFTAVSSDNGVGGPATVGDIESLYFGVPKQYRRADLNPRLISNDVTYRRFRAIPVGPADERRVMGMGGEVGSGTAGLDSYMLYGVPVSVNNNQVTNSQAAFACMKLYQLYRRLGTTFTWHDQGNYLALRNLKLLVVRGRFGGGMRDANGIAIMSDLQS